MPVMLLVPVMSGFLAHGCKEEGAIHAGLIVWGIRG